MMDFRSLPRWLLWCFVLPLMALNGWVAITIFEYFRSFFTVAILAALLAFVLSFPVNRLVRLRLPRQVATGIVLLAVLAVVGVAGILIFPLLFDQVSQLSSRLPTWLDTSNSQVQALQAWATQRQLPIDLTALISQLENRLSTQIQALGGLLLGALPAAIANLLDVFLTLVLTIYLLLHGEQIWHSLFQVLPVRASYRLKPAIARSFHNYFISQAAVAAMMGSAMTLAFLIAQVPFGLLFGLTIGVLTLIPFGAFAGIVMVSALTALQSLWLGLRVLAIATVVDQLVENAIAPQLIGQFVGLNPVWILASLLIGAKVAGFLGLIVAVPIASAIKSALLAPSPVPPAMSAADATATAHSSTPPSSPES